MERNTGYFRVIVCVGRLQKRIDWDIMLFIISKMRIDRNLRARNVRKSATQDPCRWSFWGEYKAAVRLHDWLWEGWKRQIRWSCVFIAFLLLVMAYFRELMILRILRRDSVVWDFRDLIACGRTSVIEWMDPTATVRKGGVTVRVVSRRVNTDISSMPCRAPI